MKVSSLAACALFCIILVGCSCGQQTVQPNSTTTDAKQSFALHILEDELLRARCGSRRDRCWSLLRQMDLASNSILVITEQDIEAYDWTSQSVVLTPQASLAFKDTFPNYRGLRMGSVAFVVTFEDEWLYGGVFSEAGSAAAARYPVIYLQERGDNTALAIRPFTCPIPFSVEHYQAFDIPTRSVIEIERVYEYFYELGKIVE